MIKYSSLLFLCFFVLFGCTQTQKTEKPQKSNIVIIYLNDLGYDDVSCYGGTRLKTPNIDMLTNGNTMRLMSAMDLFTIAKI